MWKVSFRFSAAVLVMVAILPAVVQAMSVEVIVPGWSDPWLAGMPDSSIASCWEPQGCDVAPYQSPQLVLELCIVPGDVLTFEVFGGVLHYQGGPPYDPPDGTYVTNHNWDDEKGENGISDVLAPYDCLLGLFLDDAQPDLSPDPPNLDFSTQESRDYLTFAPGLKQPFFIGDGLTSSGAVQRVIVPAGATRFYLGTMDSSTWLDNSGALDVIVTATCVPTPVTTITWGRLKERYR